MAKSKPIGVRFDLDKFNLVKEKNPFLKTHQSVLDYLIDFYLGNDTDHVKVYSDNAPMRSTWAKFDTLDVIAALDSVKEEKALKPPENGKKEMPRGLSGSEQIQWKIDNL